MSFSEEVAQLQTRIQGATLFDRRRTIHRVYPHNGVIIDKFCPFQFSRLYPILWLRPLSHSNPSRWLEMEIVSPDTTQISTGRDGWREEGKVRGEGLQRSKVRRCNFPENSRKLQYCIL
jgi:hypothetical protein